MTTTDPPAAVDNGEHDDDAVIGRAFRWSGSAILLVVAVGLLVWWQLRDTGADVEVIDETVAPADFRVDTALEVPPIPFTEVAAAAGIDFVPQTGAAGEKLLPETMGSGAAFLDFDGDGDQDLLLLGGRSWSDEADRPSVVLYANDGRGRFADVTAEALGTLTPYAMGCATGDYDGDGDVDVYVTCVGANLLLRNDGGRFTDVAGQLGVAGGEDEWGTGAALCDLDGDGDLDLFVANYVQWSREIDLAQSGSLDGASRSYLQPVGFKGSLPTLYRNDGGTFADVSESAGVQVTNRDTGVPAAKSMGVAPVDIDRDGLLDLVVANDTVPNFVLRNRSAGGRLAFEEIGALSGIAYDSAGQARGAMGIDAARFRDDGSLGIVIGNFANEMTALYVDPAELLSFSDEANATGLGPATRGALTFGVLWVDADLDGRLDLFCANGHLEPEIAATQRSQSYRQSPQLFWNCGSDDPTCEFRPVTGAPDLDVPTVGRGAACADIDGDGDLDVLLTASGLPPRLLRNDQALGHHWLRLKLVGAGGNTGAVGAELTLTRTDGAKLYRSVMPVRGYLSCSELPVTFGLGDDDAFRSLTVRWPDGAEQTLAPADVATDAATTVTQPE